MKYFIFFLLYTFHIILPEGFIAGTQIKTAHGNRPVESVSYGNKVYAYNTKRKKQTLSKVKKVCRSRIPYFIRGKNKSHFHLALMEKKSLSRKQHYII